MAQEPRERDPASSIARYRDYLERRPTHGRAFDRLVDLLTATQQLGNVADDRCDQLADAGKLRNGGTSSVGFDGSVFEFRRRIARDVQVTGIHGTPGGIRTPDPQVRRAKTGSQK